MHALRLLLVAVVATWFVAEKAHAQAYEQLGTLEKEGVDEALAARGLVVEPAPAGKTIRNIHVVTLEVFAKRDLFFDWFNIFHRTTREEMIRREALFRPDQPYDQAVIDETTRYLQSPDLTSTVAILPVKSVTPGAVDVLIVTRDVWSLRFNTDGEFQQGHLIYGTASLSENNLFGWRKQVAMVLEIDQGSVAVGPTYVDRNIAGTRLTLSSSVRALFAREGGASEGSRSSTSVAYPIYSLASRWGGHVTFGHFDGMARAFQGNDLRKVPVMGQDLDWRYHIQQLSASAGASRQFRQARVVHVVSTSYGVATNRPSFTDDFPVDPAVREEFAQQVFPLSQRVAAVSAGYSIYTPRWLTYRDLNTFDLREDVRMGPSAGVSLARAARFIGSDREYVSFAASAGWNLSLLGGLQGVSAGWGARLQSGAVTDQSFSGGLSFASPVLRRVLRIVASAGFATVVDDTQRQVFALGGTNGLRGYAIADFFAPRAQPDKTTAVGHLEVRSMALKVISLRLGGLVFYDVGGVSLETVPEGSVVRRALESIRAVQLHQDFGFGLRLLIPQFNAYVIRFDWAFATDNTMLTRAGWPGRISIGFQQAF